MKTSTQELQAIAKTVRKDIIEMIYKAGSGHPGGSLSSVEILVALYFCFFMDYSYQPEVSSYKIKKA